MRTSMPVGFYCMHCWHTHRVSLTCGRCDCGHRQGSGTSATITQSSVGDAGEGAEKAASSAEQAGGP
jgi:hypothetical protein